MLLLDLLQGMLRNSIDGWLEPGATASSSTGDEAPPLWQFSSFELMNGVDVTDFSETISGEAFTDLFPR
jgi:hypothetical protein